MTTNLLESRAATEKQLGYISRMENELGIPRCSRCEPLTLADASREIARLQALQEATRLLEEGKRKRIFKTLRDNGLSKADMYADCGIVSLSVAARATEADGQKAIAWLEARVVTKPSEPSAASRFASARPPAPSDDEWSRLAGPGWGSDAVYDAHPQIDVPDVEAAAPKPLAQPQARPPVPVAEKTAAHAAEDRPKAVARALTPAEQALQVETFSRHPVVKKVLAMFPGAKVVAIRSPARPPMSEAEIEAVRNMPIPDFLTPLANAASYKR